MTFSPAALETALDRSRFRSRFRLDAKDLAYIEKKGLAVIRQHAYEFVQSRLAPAEPKNDGSQTPFRGHPVFKAQHATATCCRNCVAKWYGIEKGRPFTDRESEIVVNSIMGWIVKKRTRRFREGTL